MTAALIGAAGVVLAALIGLVGIIAARRMNALEDRNTAQHNAGYGLLQSIDARTIVIAEVQGVHGERIARLESDRRGPLGERYRLDNPEEGPGRCDDEETQVSPAPL